MIWSLVLKQKSKNPTTYSVPNKSYCRIKCKASFQSLLSNLFSALFTSEKEYFFNQKKEVETELAEKQTAFQTFEQVGILSIDLY